MEQLVSGEEKQRWEGERERLVARIKELQVAATLHLYTPLITPLHPLITLCSE